MVLRRNAAGLEFERWSVFVLSSDYVVKSQVFKLNTIMIACDL